MSMIFLKFHYYAAVYCDFEQFAQKQRLTRKHEGSNALSVAVTQF
jgi:hypothetical protein